MSYSSLNAPVCVHEAHINKLLVCSFLILLLILCNPLSFVTLIYKAPAGESRRVRGRFFSSPINSLPPFLSLPSHHAQEEMWRGCLVSIGWGTAGEKENWTRNVGMLTGRWESYVHVWMHGSPWPGEAISVSGPSQATVFYSRIWIRSGDTLIVLHNVSYFMHLHLRNNSFKLSNFYSLLEMSTNSQ